jgi:hypothetical protein
MKHVITVLLLVIALISYKKVNKKVAPQSSQK